MVLIAGVLDLEFAQKSRSSRYQTMQWLPKTNYVTIRAGTWVLQRNPHEIFDGALAFVQYMCTEPTAPDFDQDYIVNMNQTLSFFLMVPRTTLKLRGKSTFHIASTDGSTARVSVTVGVEASRKLFKPMLTFKGSLTGQVALREFPTYTNMDECLLTCPRKVWVAEKNLMRWIHGILVAYLEVRPVGVTPIVVLDSYTVHKIGYTVQTIKNLGARVYHIPGGVPVWLGL